MNRSSAEAANACESCTWWDPSIQLSAAQPDTTGLCRVASPVADDRSGKAIWPFTEDTDWCGKHEQTLPALYRDLLTDE